MHGQDRHAQIHGVHIHSGHEFGDGSAAARVHRAQLAGLPVNALRVHDSDHLGHGLGAGVVGAGLSSCPRVFGQHAALVDVAGVAGLVDVGESGVVGRVHVRGQAERISQHIPCLHSGLIRQIFYVVEHVIRIQPRVAVGTDLFLVGQDRHGGAGRLLCLNLRQQGRIRANPVVLSVRAHHAAVKTHVCGLVGRNHLNLRPVEVVLRDPVHFI